MIFYAHNNLALGAIALLPFFVSCAGATKDLPPQKLKKFTGGIAHAQHVDLEQMMGDWIVFANIPYWAERDAYGSIERYQLDSQGRIPTEFYFRKGKPSGPVKRVRSLARVVDHKSNATWQVEFFGVIKIPYIIAEVSPEYRWALIAHPSRNLGWILSRERLSDEQYRAILTIAKERGYNPDKFQKVPESEPFDLPPRRVTSTATSHRE